MPASRARAMALAVLAIASAALIVAIPASASSGKDKYAGRVYDDSNHFYLDYKTDLSEARRELRKDLARANDAADRIDAWAESIDPSLRRY